MSETMTYYKAFNPDLTCRNFQFEIGETYKLYGDPVLYEYGFHCCKCALNCLKYYKPPYRLCEVSIGSKYSEGYDQTVSIEINIIREIIGNELNTLLTGVINDYNGDKYWFDKGLLHRELDLPSMLLDYGGSAYWYKKGIIHRDGDLPAIVKSHDFAKYWYKEGKLHRDGNRPAIIYKDGTKYWYVNGYKYDYNEQKIGITVLGPTLIFGLVIILIYITLWLR